VSLPKFDIMLPDGDDRPPMLAEFFRGPVVPAPVGVELGCPEPRIGGWQFPVLGAAVPEAAVDEDGRAPAYQCEVRTAGEPLRVSLEDNPKVVEGLFDGRLRLEVVPRD